jgi:hypothetical protein
VKRYRPLFTPISLSSSKTFSPSVQRRITCPSTHASERFDRIGVIELRFKVLTSVHARRTKILLLR